MRVIVLGISFIASVQILACDITVNNSTSLKFIAQNAEPGQEICIDGIGEKIYEIDYIHFKANGTEDKPIIFKGLDSVHLLGVNAQEGKANFHVSGSWLKIQNLEISNFENGINIRRMENNIPHNTNIIDIRSHHNLYSGIAIEGDYIIGEGINPNFHNYTNEDKPSNNIIKNCDTSYSQAPGDNGDGINIRNGVGTGNMIIGCRTFNNADDGVDLWEAGNQVHIINTWSYKNGFDENGIESGNGVGFKLGRAINLNGTIYDGMHILKHCMAWENREYGFSYSEAIFSREFYNCTAYGNFNSGFYFENNDNAFLNNISHSNANSDRYGPHYNEANEPKPWYELGNSWQLAQNLYDSSFILTQNEKNIAEGSRGSTDSLPNTKWLQLKKNINYPNIGYWGEE